MGTGFKDGFQTGLIPQVMNALFGKIDTLKHQTEFQLHVSFIEVCSLRSLLRKFRISVRLLKKRLETGRNTTKVIKT